MTTRDEAYDHPQYITHQFHGYGQNAAGASTNFGKWVAPCAAFIYAVRAANITASTSTQTSWNGNGTANVVQINADQFNVIHVINGAAVSTTTHGPFGISTGTATTTATAGAQTIVPLSGTGTTGNVQAGTNTSTGGVAVNAGDTVHILRGTDATAVSAFTLEWSPQPLTQITA